MVSDNNISGQENGHLSIIGNIASNIWKLRTWLNYVTDLSLKPPSDSSCLCDLYILQSSFSTILLSGEHDQPSLLSVMLKLWPSKNACLCPGAQNFPQSKHLLYEGSLWVGRNVSNLSLSCSEAPYISLHLPPGVPSDSCRCIACLKTQYNKEAATPFFFPSPRENVGKKRLSRNCLLLSSRKWVSSL